MKIYTLLSIDIETGRTLAEESHEYSGPVALAKGDAAKGDALTNAQTGQQGYGTLFNEGQQTQGEVLPFLNQEITNPQGFGQQQLNAMNTATGHIRKSGAVSHWRGLQALSKGPALWSKAGPTAERLVRLRAPPGGLIAKSPQKGCRLANVFILRPSIQI